MGELQWSQDRWRYSTFPEFSYAVSGYWRNWERFVGVPMREVCFWEQFNSQYLKPVSKVNSAQEYMKLSIDKEKKIEKPTKEEIERLKEQAKELLNGRKQI